MGNTNQHQKKVTVLGLGQMGSTLSTLLLKNEYEVTVWNRTISKADELVKAGVKAESNLIAAIEASEVIIVCVLDYKASNTILLPKEVSAVITGKTLIQLTTGSPKEAKEMGAWATDFGINFLDGAIQVAPEQMGKPDTTILISGKEETYTNSEAILKTFGGNVKYLGQQIASASVMDLATLSTIYGTLIGFFHAARIAENEGFRVDLLGNIIAEIMPSFTAFIQHEATVIQSGNFSVTQSPLSISVGATQRILEAAEESNINTEFPAFAAGLLARASKAGYENEELAALIKTLRTSC